MCGETGCERVCRKWVCDQKVCEEWGCDDEHEVCAVMNG